MSQHSGQHAGSTSQEHHNTTASDHARQHNGNVYNYYGSEPRIASPTQAQSEVKAPTAIATGNGARLWRAARLGQLPLVRRLLKLGADVRYRCNEHGTTALHQAAKNAHKNVVEALLEAGAEVDDEDNEGSIALHVATSADVVEAMVMAGADVDHEDRAGRTPGRRACERSDMSVVQVLLDGHADPSKIPYTVENGGDGGPASQDLQLIDQATLKQHDELDQTSPGLTARPIAPSTTHGPSTLDRSVTNPDRKVVIGIALETGVEEVYFLEHHQYHDAYRKIREEDVQKCISGQVRLLRARSKQLGQSDMRVVHLVGRLGSLGNSRDLKALMAGIEEENTGIRVMHRRQPNPNGPSVIGTEAVMYGLLKNSGDS